MAASLPKGSIPEALLRWATQHTLKEDASGLSDPVRQQQLRERFATMDKKWYDAIFGESPVERLRRLAEALKSPATSDAEKLGLLEDLQDMVESHVFANDFARMGEVPVLLALAKPAAAAAAAPAAPAAPRRASSSSAPSSPSASASAAATSSDTAVDIDSPAMLRAKVRMHALWVLGAGLQNNAPFQQAVLVEGGMATILNAVNLDRDMEVKHKAAHALSGLLRGYPPALAVFVQPQVNGFPAVVTALLVGPTKLKRRCAFLLAYLAREGCVPAEQWRKTSAVRALVAAASKSDDLSLREHALQCLLNLSKLPEPTIVKPPAPQDAVEKPDTGSDPKPAPLVIDLPPLPDANVVLRNQRALLQDPPALAALQALFEHLAAQGAAAAGTPDAADWTVVLERVRKLKALVADAAGK